MIHDLIEIPRESERALEAAEVAPPTLPLWAVFSIDQAQRWLLEVLAEPSPLEHAIFLPFAQERGRYDVVRGRWRAGDVIFDTAQTKHLFVMTVRPTSENIERLANTLFRLPQPFHSTTTSDDGTFAHGQRDLEDGWFSRGWAHWFDSLGWWRRGRAAGFTMIKATGGPTPQVLSRADLADGHWFPSQ